jgi:hypothetical protein
MVRFYRINALWRYGSRQIQEVCKRRMVACSRLKRRWPLRMGRGVMECEKKAYFNNGVR